MKAFAKYPAAMPRFPIREVMELARNREGVIHLHVGQPDFEAPRAAIAATIESLQLGETQYVANAGMLELRETVARYLADSTGVATSAEQIVISSGALMSLAIAMIVLLDPADEILVPDPGYQNTYEVVKMIGAVPVPYALRAEHEFRPQLNELQSLVTPRTKAILLCSPSNPTGQVYERSLMESLVAFAREHDLHCVSDEIYASIVFDGEHSSATSCDRDERCIVVGGLSKSHSMCGYRLGYTRATESYAAVASNVQEAFFSCVPPFVQRGAIAAIEKEAAYVIEMREVYRARRDIALDVLREHGLYSYTPGGAFYLLVNISATGMDSREFALWLLDKKNVAVAPGCAFGENVNDHVRISLASSEEDIRVGTRILCEAILAGGPR